jgi:hypothetical protein
MNFNFNLIIEFIILVIFSVLIFKDYCEDDEDDEISRKEEIIITIISAVLSISLVHYFF